jgi:phospholipid/cholesterol/gamma-HCH transport system permease protein
MDAGAGSYDRVPAEGRPPSAGARLRRGLGDPLDELARETGEIVSFFGRALAETAGAWRYSAEVLRQAMILIVGSALVIWFMQFVMGSICATNAAYVLKTYGASGYSGLYTAYCAVRELGPYMFGYILAAKVGCGYVAEIGSMRINDELDAMEAQGINPMRYVVATRLLACWLVFPAIYLVGLAFNFLSEFLVITKQIGEVSQGGWEFVHWQFQSPYDHAVALLKVMTFGTAIVVIAMSYGYRARGGPVGVGTATARSMIINLVVLHLLGALITMVFWGLNLTGPIGG